MKISVLGSGGWGTAAAVLLAGNGHEVVLWSFSPEEAAKLEIARENERFLPGVRIPEEITVTTDISCAESAEMVVFAVPSFALVQTAERVRGLILRPGSIFTLLTKGFDRENGCCLFSESLARVLGDAHPIVALTGPSHAEEVARGVPGAVVAAGRDRAACEAVQEAFMNAFFRVYTTPDIVGAQLGGGLKNVIALAAGVCDGMELGDNTKAALVTRGLTEMARLGVAAGGMSQTLAGLSGLGDLIVTCTSIHSRNYRAGRLVGQGKTAMDAMREVGAVVEGYYAAAAARELAGRFHVEMPISDAVHRVLYEGADARQAIRALLSRQRRGEIEESWLAGGQMEWS